MVEPRLDGFWAPPTQHLTGVLLYGYCSGFVPGGQRICLFSAMVPSGILLIETIVIDAGTVRDPKQGPRIYNQHPAPPPPPHLSASDLTCKKTPQTKFITVTIIRFLTVQGFGSGCRKVKCQDASGASMVKSGTQGPICPHVP